MSKSPFQRESAPARHGTSLVELLVVIAVSASLFALATVMFARFLAMRSAGEEHFQRTTQVGRLAEQFRRDVWEGQQAALPEGETDKLTITGNQQRVEYLIRSGAIERTVIDGEGDTPQLRETYSLATAAPLRFEVHDARLSVLIAPLHAKPVEGESPHGKPTRIAATLGRDDRFTASSEEQP